MAGCGYTVAAAATPTTRLAVETIPVVGTEHGGAQPPDAADRVPLDVQARHGPQAFGVPKGSIRYSAPLRS